MSAKSHPWRRRMLSPRSAAPDSNIAVPVAMRETLTEAATFPYLRDVAAIKLSIVALQRVLPNSEGQTILGIMRPALQNLEKLVRADHERRQRIAEINAEKQLTPEQEATEQAEVDRLADAFKAGARGRVTKSSICAYVARNSSIPKRRIVQYVHAHGRATRVFATK